MHHKAYTRSKPKVSIVSFALRPCDCVEACGRVIGSNRIESKMATQEQESTPPVLLSDDLKSYKNQVQELCQRSREPMPRYSTTADASGGFTSLLEALGHPGIYGHGTTKKAAERDAALNWLQLHHAAKAEAKGSNVLCPGIDFPVSVFVDAENVPEVVQRELHEFTIGPECNVYVFASTNTYETHAKEVEQLPGVFIHKVASDRADAVDIEIVYRVGLWNDGSYFPMVVVSKDHFASTLASLHEHIIHTTCLADINDRITQLGWS